jgi:AraC-like DNA-binding protein
LTPRAELAPARLRRVSELVRTKLEDELTLDEMAESAGLSPGHFSQMFRQSTGQSPHQFVVRERIERAKEMLRAAEARVLDVAVACGFKRSSTLHGCSAECAERALPNIADSFCARCVRRPAVYGRGQSFGGANCQCNCAFVNGTWFSPSKIRRFLVSVYLVAVKSCSSSKA